MQIVRDRAALRRALHALRCDGTIALVPTMGALHAGHLALVEEARRRARNVVASIFVNPLQFGAGEDFAAYPRSEVEDGEQLAAAGCALLWVPDAATMYPPGFATKIIVDKVSDGLCGGARPGHFSGVATVVAKLLNQVRPDIALFGEKDYQQLIVIRRMVDDLDMGVEIVGVATQRDDDGLALSSRNAYLSPDQRIAARSLPTLLARAANDIEAGGDAAAAVARVREGLLAAGFERVDYVELRDAATLAPLAAATAPGRLMAAARIGRARLIDNFAVAQEKS
ncbi:MAG: pantoate--beta-alanine ligase [Sphingosinicella sp.]